MMTTMVAIAGMIALLNLQVACTKFILSWLPSWITLELWKGVWHSSDTLWVFAHLPEWDQHLSA